MKLKVYGYRGHRRAAYSTRNTHSQTREIVAATSKAAARQAFIAAGAFGCPISECVETGNKKELEVALADPGVVFWQPLDPYGTAFTRAAPALPIHKK